MIMEKKKVLVKIDGDIKDIDTDDFYYDVDIANYLENEYFAGERIYDPEIEVSFDGETWVEMECNHEYSVNFSISKK